MKSRRDFLKRLGLGAAVPLAIGAASMPTESADDFLTSNGVRVRWAGWRYPMNQDVRLGFWVADLGHRRIAYSTTLGRVVLDAREGFTFDVSQHDRSWPLSPMFSTDEDFNRAKKRARVALVNALGAL